MKSNMKPLIILLVFSLFAYGVYYVFTEYDVFSSAKVRAADVEKNTAELERTILSQLEDISKISFDAGLFAREDYKSLQDLSIELPKPRVSRPNPFSELP